MVDTRLFHQQSPPQTAGTAPIAQGGKGSLAQPQPSAQRQGRRGQVLKGAGLVAVAVVAGLVWWLIRHDPAPAQGAAEPQTTATDHAGDFDFDRIAGPVRSNDCAGNAYGKVKEWFGTQPCQALARALYVTKPGGKRALVSVVVVTMPTPAQAQELKALTDQENTGNVSDLVRDGTTTVPDGPKVADGEYASKVDDRTVTIVEANFYDQHKDKPTLAKISVDALGL